jgi:hypothetical protein
VRTHVAAIFRSRALEGHRRADDLRSWLHVVKHRDVPNPLEGSVRLRSGCFANRRSEQTPRHSAIAAVTSAKVVEHRVSSRASPMPGDAYWGASERSKQLIAQLELAIADLEETQAEEETKAEMATAAPQNEKRTRAGVRRGLDRCPKICIGTLRLRLMRRHQTAQARPNRDQDANSRIPLERAVAAPDKSARSEGVAGTRAGPLWDRHEVLAGCREVVRAIRKSS